MTRKQLQMLHIDDLRVLRWHLLALQTNVPKVLDDKNRTLKRIALELDVRAMRTT